MAFRPPIQNGNPWPKPWAVQHPVIGHNLSRPQPSKFQKSLKLAYHKDIRVYRKYYNKNISQVICSGISMPKILSSRGKQIRSLELYENSQIKSGFSNLTSVKLGQVSQKKISLNQIKHIVKYNKRLREILVDHEETMRAIEFSLKCPRLLGSFSLGTCNIPKNKLKKRMQFLNRHSQLKEVAFCTTETHPTQLTQPIENEAKDFAAFLSLLFKKKSLKTLKLDVMDPRIIQMNHLLEDFIFQKLKEKALENFDLRFALTTTPLMNQGVQEILSQIDYFALSINGVPFQKSGAWAEEMLRRQENSKRRLMIDFRRFAELDLDPFLSHVSFSIQVLDLSFNSNDDNGNITCDWVNFLSKLQSLQSLSINFTRCPYVLIPLLTELSSAINSLPSLKSTALNLESIEFSPEVYQAIDKYYQAIRHIPEHSFGLLSSQPTEVQLDTLCASLQQLTNLRSLKFMVHLIRTNSLLCFGEMLHNFKALEKLEMHIRFDTHEIIPFNLPLEWLSNLNHLRIELLFRPPVEFVDHLNTSISKLFALEHLELNILYYSKIRYPIFKSLLMKLNKLQALKEVEMSVNIEDENMNESLMEKNLKLKRDMEDFFQNHPALTRIMFHHFVSYICCTR